MKTIKYLLIMLAIAASCSSCVVRAGTWVPGHYNYGPYGRYWVRGHYA